MKRVALVSLLTLPFAHAADLQQALSEAMNIFSGFDILNLYQTASGFIDALLVFLLFFFVFKSQSWMDHFGTKMPVILALMFTISLFGAKQVYGIDITLLQLGPIALLIFFAIFASMLAKTLGHIAPNMPATLRWALAGLATFIFSIVMLQDNISRVIPESIMGYIVLGGLVTVIALVIYLLPKHAPQEAESSDAVPGASSGIFSTSVKTAKNAITAMKKYREMKQVSSELEALENTQDTLLHNEESILQKISKTLPYIQQTKEYIDRLLEAKRRPGANLDELNQKGNQAIEYVKNIQRYLISYVNNDKVMEAELSKELQAYNELKNRFVTSDYHVIANGVKNDEVFNLAFPFANAIKSAEKNIQDIIAILKTLDGGLTKIIAQCNTLWTTPTSTINQEIAALQGLINQVLMLNNSFHETQKVVKTTHDALNEAILKHEAEAAKSVTP